MRRGEEKRGERRREECEERTGEERRKEERGEKGGIGEGGKERRGGELWSHTLTHQTQDHRAPKGDAPTPALSHSDTRLSRNQIRHNLSSRKPRLNSLPSRLHNRKTAGASRSDVSSSSDVNVSPSPSVVSLNAEIADDKSAG